MISITATDLPLFMACNGSRNMPPSFPKTEGDTEQRDLGNAADWLATAVFNGQFSIDEMADRKAPNGVHITVEMVDHVSEYLAALDCGAVQVDTSFTCSGIVNGRADHVATLCNANDQYENIETIIIDDLKYGWRIVSPEMNWTLIAHAIGETFKNGHWAAFYIFRIHQPRPYHPDGKLREWRITGAELAALYEQLNAALADPKDELRTNPHCPNCHAFATCPASRKAQLNAIDATESAVFSDDISDDLLSYELDTLRASTALLEHRMKALEELAKHRLTIGAVVPNYAVDHAYGNRKFKTEYNGSLLTALTGVSMTKDAMITPPEAERRLVASGKTKQQAEQIIKPFVDRPYSGVKLIRQTADKRAKKLLEGAK